MRTANLTARPRYGLGDVLALLLRETVLMIVVFLLIFALGAAAVLTLKKTYTASAKVFAGVGQEYVYQPRVGTAERGQAPNIGEVAQSEAAILGSQEVKRRVVQALGAETILGPDAADADPVSALKAVEGSLGVGTEVGSAVIGVSYETDDPARAALILNTVIDQYLIYRREVFQDRTTPAIRAQREVFEEELALADSAYEQFLISNDIGDFAAAKAGLAVSYQTVFADRLSVQAQLNQTGQRLATLVAQQAGTPAEIALQQDLNVTAQDRLLQLRNEREALLSRYTAGSQPIRDIDAQIAQMESYVANGQTVGVKEVRTGPNPIWVELETTRINTQAERDSLSARLAVLDSQLGQIMDRQSRLTAMESANANLSGEREVLQSSIKEFQQRETQARADSGLVKAGADNVTVIERAAPPTQGKSLKIPLLAGIFLFAGFTALCVGLARVFSRKGFTTPGSAGRTLDLPVLAVAPLKAR
ncbi:chain-length determining protein [Rhizobium sp. CRIBSB]|nr:chain-length determining protein [Rhizobium sp. CRIBSB]